LAEQTFAGGVAEEEFDLVEGENQRQIPADAFESGPGVEAGRMQATGAAEQSQVAGVVSQFPPCRTGLPARSGAEIDSEALGRFQHLRSGSVKDFRKKGGVEAEELVVEVRWWEGTSAGAAAQARRQIEEFDQGRAFAQVALWVILVAHGVGKKGGGRPLAQEFGTDLGAGGRETVPFHLLDPCLGLIHEEDVLVRLGKILQQDQLPKTVQQAREVGLFRSRIAGQAGEVASQVGAEQGAKPEGGGKAFMPGGKLAEILVNGAGQGQSAHRVEAQNHEQAADLGDLGPWAVAGGVGKMEDFCRKGGFLLDNPGQFFEFDLGLMTQLEERHQNFWNGWNPLDAQIFQDHGHRHL
jgi:hypothetical protein